MLHRSLAQALLGAMLLLNAPAGAAGEPLDLGRVALERIDGTPGVCVAIGTIEDGKSAVLFRGETGSAAKLDRDTIFEIGSVTKTFTALLLADMVGRGELSLDQSIDTLLPAGSTAPTRGGKHITLLDLATQTSGLPRLPDNLAPKNFHDPYAGYDDARLFEFLSTYRLTRDIGAQYEYSNYGVGLLGRLLALHAGISYEDVLRQRVLAPLAMSATGIAFTPQMRARLAAGHDADGEPAANWDMASLAAAGGLHSSLADMLRFLRAVMIPDGELGSAARLAEQPRREAFPGTRIGLVWNTDDSDGIVWHNGETGGYHAFVGFTADRTRGIVVLTNAALPIDDVARHWLDPTLALTPVLRTIAIDRETLGVYAGTYEFNGVHLVFTREGDRLYAKLGDQPRFRVYPYAPDEFFWKVVPARVTFTVAGGKATSAVLHQGGRDYTATRISD